MISLDLAGDPRLAVLIASLLPGFEARYALIVGLTMGLSLGEALAYSVLGVALLALALYLAVERLDGILSRWSSLGGLRGLAGSFYLRLRSAAARRAGRYVERWGAAGLALFIAVPLPVTGMYTGSLAALILGIRGHKLALSLTLGGLASLLIMAAASAAATSLPG